MPGCTHLLFLHDNSPQNNKHVLFFMILHAQVKTKDSDEGTVTAQRWIWPFLPVELRKPLKTEAPNGGLSPQTEAGTKTVGERRLFGRKRNSKTKSEQCEATEWGSGNCAEISAEAGWGRGGSG